MTLQSWRLLRGDLRVVSAAADLDRVMPTTMGDEDRHKHAVIRAPTAFEVVQHERCRDLTPL
jgi:hypothetical protein